ncbi:MAG TPA: sigma-70 family RNA polymerase sigma factor [Gaiellaceae bacterium]|nr:sigma-70 family RNA polymerase sigma factor [Gaiellaceae bacterium]
MDARLREIETLYRSRFTHFVRVATAVTGDRELALDAVHDAFAGAVRGRRGFRREGPLEAWLWRAVVNAALKAREREVVETRVRRIDVERDGYVTGSGELGAVIAALPERQRLALFLRYYADLDYRGIAVALGVEVGTVSATLSAAHTAVRRALEEVTR